MAFFFPIFTMNPRTTQNCWSTSNFSCSPTFDSDIGIRSSAKNNNSTWRRLGLVHHILFRPSVPPGHPNITQIVGGWEDNLASYLAGTWSWRWHLRLSGWCVRYPWHTSPASIARNVPLPWSQPTPTIALHVAQYQTPFWSLQNNNKVVSFLPCSIILEFTIWRVG
jgi:hypothetical protein